MTPLPIIILLTGGETITTATQPFTNAKWVHKGNSMGVKKGFCDMEKLTKKSYYDVNHTRIRVHNASCAHNLLTTKNSEYCRLPILIPLEQII